MIKDMEKLIQYNTIQYNTKFVKRHVAVASEALYGNTVVRRVAGTMRSVDDAERRRRRDSALATGQIAFFCRLCENSAAVVDVYTR